MKASKTQGVTNLGPVDPHACVEAEEGAMPKDTIATPRTVTEATIEAMTVKAVLLAGEAKDEVGVEAAAVAVHVLLLHVVKASLREERVVDLASNLRPPMLEASKAVLTHGTIPMRIKIQTLKEAMEIDKAPNKVMVRADVVEAAAAEVEANLVKTLSTTPATGVMIFPMPTSGTTKSTLDHWQTLRYLRPPEASLNLVRNSGHRNPKVVSNNSNNLLCNNNLNRIVANEASI